MTEPSERLSDAVLEQIARKGVAYTREAKLMARELLERRRKEAQSFNPYADGIGGICP
jgi:hypothetical protein